MKEKTTENIQRTAQHIAEWMEKSGRSEITIPICLFDRLVKNHGWYVQKFMREQMNFACEMVWVKPKIRWFRPFHAYKIQRIYG